MNTPAQSTVAATLDAIDAATATRCGHCNGPIPVGCVSDDFCCEGCQRAWIAGHHGARQLPHDWNDVVPPMPARPPRTHTYARCDLLPAFTIDNEAGVGASEWTDVPTADDRAALRFEIARPFHLTPDQADLLAVAFQSVVDQVNATFAPVFEQLRTGVWQDAADQPPADPMERALHLRRNRNTGPRPRQRAPRRIDPRRSR